MLQCFKMQDSTPVTVFMHLSIKLTTYEESADIKLLK